MNAQNVCPLCGNHESDLVDGKECYGLPGIIYRRCKSCGNTSVADLSHKEIRAFREAKEVPS